MTLNLKPAPNIDPRYKNWSVTPHATPGLANLPYAYCMPAGVDSLAEEGRIPGTRLAWAQDAARRDVALKLVNTDTDEYRIYSRLLKSVEAYSPSLCCGVLRPVAILETPHNFAFIVMPRSILQLGWSTLDVQPQYGRPSDAIYALHIECKTSCMIANHFVVIEIGLQGLRFLHEQRVIHRDIHQSNMLLNCYSPDAQFSTNAQNIADAHRQEALVGAPCYLPSDIWLGEQFYNPFAYDVACLGNMYRVFFTCLVSQIPLLAPLFDKMTTHQISHRFTAHEAANFIESVYASLSDTALNSSVAIVSEWDSFTNTYLYWSQTPPEFAAQWSAYRPLTAYRATYNLLTNIYYDFTRCVYVAASACGLGVSLQSFIPLLNVWTLTQAAASIPHLTARLDVEHLAFEMQACVSPLSPNGHDVSRPPHSSDVVHEFSNPPNSSPADDFACLPHLHGGTVEDVLESRLPYYAMEALWTGYQSRLSLLRMTLRGLRDSRWYMPATTSGAGPRPYALRCHHDGQVDSRPLSLLKRLGYCHGLLKEDVVVKLIDKGAMGDQIYRYLGRCEALYSSDAFPCVLPPTAIVASPYEFTFAAMPMWGFMPKVTGFDTIREIAAYIRCTLTGLAFLHDHRIAHRDIHEWNIMVNRYRHDGQLDRRTQSPHDYYSSPSVLYAFIDFNLALQLPPATSLKYCRRPADEALITVPIYHPFDICQGERHYNPFAFDVACLGNLFLFYFTEAITAVPSLVVLFSRMTTHVIGDRYTAAEALAFFCEVEAQLSPNTLDTGIALKASYDPLDNPDGYWSRLIPESQLRLQLHRPPPLSWTNRVLRWLMTTRPGRNIIPFVRRALCI
ncbi:hypothetical protein ONZ51_g9638 [Trametes cubensis]|uniref:Protein kinase domain-containing protein n=1 Tax=Trametes cubensis TaxID=1111947 RepID=A0AAD7TLF5_9APHY|nr:hypothetical protein ONZ51_g9638 [Trametes cubensis]